MSFANIEHTTNGTTYLNITLDDEDIKNLTSGGITYFENIKISEKQMKNQGINIYINTEKSVLNETNSKDIAIPEVKTEPQPKPKEIRKLTSKDETDKIDKYIALFKEDLIGKEDLLKLISNNKKRNLSPRTNLERCKTKTN